MDVSFFINDILVTFTGDREMVRLLEDDNYALNYIKEAIKKGDLINYGIDKDVSILNIERGIEPDSADDNNSDPGEIWSKRGKVTGKDFEATEYFLTLRSSAKYVRLFQDKRSVKLNIWADIANEMKKAGYFVGEGKLGAQKCRQKFQNLTKNYILFVRHVNSTGKERKEPPEHYELLHAILGDKDKIKLKNIQDSLNNNENKIQETLTAQAGTSSFNDSDIIEAEPIIAIVNTELEKESLNTTKDKEIKEKQDKNRFSAVKTTVKPIKQDIVNVIQSLHKENLDQQNQQFHSLHALIENQNKLLSEQNKQRDRLIDAFVEMTKRSKKRKYDSDSE